jgi:putative salt-induced outer membrane protein YdiY
MMSVLLSLLALAQEPEFAETDKEGAEVEKPKRSLGAELGGALSAGNSQAFSVNSGITGEYRWTANKFSGNLGALFGQSVVDADGNGILSEAERDAGYVTNQQQVVLDLRYDRYLSKKNSLYVLVGLLHDRFAGFETRSHQQIGYSRLLVDSDTTELVAELGFDWAQENYYEDQDPAYQNVFAARVMLGFSHTFNESVTFRDTFEVYPNVVVFEDVRILNTASLTAKLSDKLGFKTAYNLRFDNQPVEGFRRADHAITASLVVTLL